MTVPAAAVGLTEAVSVIDVPTVAEVNEEVSVVVVAISAEVTVTVTADEVLVAYVLVPLNVAVMLCEPTLSVLTASVATPEVTLTDPREVVPS